MTLIVNLYGAPGSGKSTTRAGVFNRLKLSKVHCEEVFEYAKDLVWEKRYGTLACQPYVFGKQLKRIETLVGQVDVIITDSPILLSAFYGRKNTDYPESFYSFIIDMVKRENSMNFLIKRVKDYDPRGRNEDETGSDQIGKEIEKFLKELKLGYRVIDGDEEAAKTISDAIIRKIK